MDTARRIAWIVYKRTRGKRLVNSIAK